MNRPARFVLESMAKIFTFTGLGPRFLISTESSIVLPGWATKLNQVLFLELGSGRARLIEMLPEALALAAVSSSKINAPRNISPQRLMEKNEK